MKHVFKTTLYSKKEVETEYETNIVDQTIYLFNDVKYEYYVKIIPKYNLENIIFGWDIFKIDNSFLKIIVKETYCINELFVEQSAIDPDWKEVKSNFTQKPRKEILYYLLFQENDRESNFKIVTQNDFLLQVANFLK